MQDERRTLVVRAMLDEIDREWDAERERYYIRELGGSLIEPTDAVVGVRLARGIGVGLLGLFVALFFRALGPAAYEVVLIGGLGAVLGIYTALMAIKKGQAYAQAQADYAARREAVYHQYPQ